MCGIAGFTHRTRLSDPGRIQSAIGSLTHRGPDRQAVFESRFISLGAARLKIIDLESGDQPMHVVEPLIAPTLAILMLMTWQEQISVDPKVLVGKPVIKGTRLAVELIIDLLAKGWTQEQILDSYPNLTAQDIRACLAYASEVLHAERVYPLTPA